MTIDLTRLKSGIDKNIEINQTCSFNDFNKNEILELNNIEVKGIITKDSMDNYVINGTIKGRAILPCSITLKPVNYDFDIEINGILEEMLKEINDFDKKIENTIDILPIIWENVLMEIPIKVVSDEAKNINLEGNGWKFITDDKKTDVNPVFEKLNELLK